MAEPVPMGTPSGQPDAEEAKTVGLPATSPADEQEEDLSFADKLKRRFNLAAATVFEEEDNFMQVITPEDHADVSSRTAIFERLTSEFSCDVGKQESRKERNERGLKDINLTYGEIEFKSFFQVFKWIQKTYKDNDPDCWHNAFNVPGGQFVDLGHGTGKGVLSGAFMHSFEKVWGIEILQSLQTVSENLKRVYDTYLTEVDPADYEQIFQRPLSAASAFEVVLGDILEIDWSMADMIFANSTCFNSQLMEAIYERSKKCKKGTFFVTMSKRLPHAETINENSPDPNLHWEFILAIKLKMSWGMATVNVQRKITHPVGQ